MANYFTRFLTGVGNGLTNPKGGLGDWRHAARVFVDSQYRLAPRTKFLFYVRFEIDKSIISSNTFTNRHADEVGYLIKSTDLPKYKFDTITKNQYNRKKLVYKNFTYEPIAMTFRDDSAGIMNAMWALYMSTYVQDRLNPEKAFSRTNLRAAGEARDGFRYGLDKAGKSSDFFTSISIYTMSRRRFQGYTLVNPKITNWASGGGDYSSSEFNEMSMNIEYESVVYSSGNVSVGNPKGFANLYYDNVPSPLTVAGGGVANVFGEGGVLDGLESVFGDISSGSAFGSVGGFLGTAIAAVNTAKNVSRIKNSPGGILGALKGEAINILSSPSNLKGIVNTVGGVVGAAFPKNSGETTNTEATQKSLIPGSGV
jgi:hypothetical protein